MSDLCAVQNVFVQRLPTLQRMAKISFRHLPPEAKEESISNAVALAWKFFYNLFLKKRWEEPGILNSCMRFAIRQTREGRTPQGCPKAKELLGPRWVGPTRLADFDPEEFVSRSTAIPEAVSFRVDVPEFLSTLTDRQRRMSLDLAAGMTTSEAALKYGVSAGRVSQWRRRFKDLFDVFFAD